MLINFAFVKCKYCHIENSIKKGVRKGVQRYYCKNCEKCFQEKYVYNADSATTNSSIILLLKEGCGIRSIGRILKISKNTVLSRKLNISKYITVPNITMSGAVYEVDEMFVKVSNGKKNWLTYAIEKESREVVGFVLGSRSKISISPLINKLLQSNPLAIYTDKMKAYPALIPSNIHKVFRYLTNRIERKNLTLRTHIKRLSRKTICYSKSLQYLEAHLKIYFWTSQSHCSIQT